MRWAHPCENIITRRFNIFSTVDFESFHCIPTLHYPNENKFIWRRQQLSDMSVSCLALAWIICHDTIDVKNRKIISFSSMFAAGKQTNRRRWTKKNTNNTEHKHECEWLIIIFKTIVIFTSILLLYHLKFLFNIEYTACLSIH